MLRIGFLFTLAGLLVGCGRIGYDAFQTRDGGEVDLASDMTLVDEGVDANLDAGVDLGMDAGVDMELADLGVDAETPDMPRSAGIVVTAASGLTTSEAGGTAMFTVELLSAPTADVSVEVESSDTSEGNVASSTLIFTSATWNMPQAVIITGVDDALADGDVSYAITVGMSMSTDLDYDGLSGDTVTVINTDDESAGLSITPTMGLVTTEAGGTAMFTVALRSEPTADVLLDLSSSNLAEGTVSPATLTFTAGNWNVAQVVMVTGVDDAIADGDQSYIALVHVNSSADSDYAALADRTVALLNTDDESAGIVVSPTSGLFTDEAGATATFTIVLNSQPTSGVTIGLSSNLPSEGTPFPTSVSFTTVNWAVPQTITVTGIDDAIADGARVYRIDTALATSADLNYDGVDAANVTLTNLDNDVAAVNVSPLAGLETSEAGTVDTFSVVLGSQPTADVTMALVSSVPSETSVAPAMLTFTSANWNTPQIVTITGLNDDVDDGNVTHNILISVASSTDLGYDGIAVDDPSVTNFDDDTAAVVVMPTSGHFTSETGGTASFTIVLASRPTANVTISLMSSDTTEGTVAPASVTFIPSLWDTPQTVTVTGQDDVIVDGDIAYSIVTGAASSGDLAYNGLAVSDVTATNTDNDSAGVTVSPRDLFTHEANGSSMFTIVLDTQPLADVTISLMSSNTGEGTVSPASVTFTALNWATPRSVIVTGVNDGVVDGSIAYTIVSGATSSTDPVYNGLEVDDVAVRNWGVVQRAYVKASNTNAGDRFGEGSVAISGDGLTMAIGARGEASAATGVGGDQSDNTAADAGAVYVFVRSGAVWTQQAYIKASNAQAGDAFGASVSLSADGNTLAVGAYGEDSNAVGINGNQLDNSFGAAGAAYVFVRSGSVWTQQAYIKPSGVSGLSFGNDIVLAADGNTLAVAKFNESSNATGINGNAANTTFTYSGAVFVYTRAGTVWTQQAYIKASNTGASDLFGRSIGLASDGSTLAVGSPWEDSAATGIGGDESSNAASDSGAAYIFVRVAGVWSQQAYIKASNSEGADRFGNTVALSGDGNTFAAASSDGSDATGINGTQSNNNAPFSGAVYVFTRSGAVWSQQAYIKASNSQASDQFGAAIALGSDGNAMVIGAPPEDGSGVGLDADPATNSSTGSGAAYVFSRTGATWTQHAYVKALNAGPGDSFGATIRLSTDNHTLVIGAPQEASNATGIDGDQSNNSMMNAGAVYVFQI